MPEADQQADRELPAALTADFDPDPAQLKAISHDQGAMLLAGAPGSGKTEAAARHLARLALESGRPESILALTATEATANRLRQRAAAMFDADHERLWVGTWAQVVERLLRDHAETAGLDPFFVVLGPAERLALLLDRLDDLPLRLHQIRGNPSGLLVRLLERIDQLKAAGIDAEQLARQAQEAKQLAGDAVARELAGREAEFADFFATHDRLLATSGSLDQGDLILTFRQLLERSSAVRAQLKDRFRYLILEEIEDLTTSQWRVLDQLAPGCVSLLATLDQVELDGLAAEDPAGRFFDLASDAALTLTERAYRGKQPLRFWRCANPRAEAQAAAREIETRIAAGADPGGIAIFVEDPAHQGVVIGAALEERGIPYRLEHSAALFQRPEVRDTIAWLRVLADPDDSAAAARALTRPPIQLGSADLARLTTIARRRKLNLVDAGAAALESPQFQPEARERIQAFCRLHQAASAAIAERRPDVFVRRLIERVGIRRQRMFAAQSEVAERLISLSRIADLASAWTRREPNGTTHDFVRYLCAVADSGVEIGIEPPNPAAERVRVIGLERAKGVEVAEALILGLGADAQINKNQLRIATSRARMGTVLSWSEGDRGDAEAKPHPLYSEARGTAGEDRYEEELFGPAEGLHAIYRLLRDDVLELSWAAGRQLYEPRLDTALDLNRAVTRYLELLKLAALAQRPENEAIGEALETINGILRQVATAAQLSELEASSLDDFLRDEERGQERRRDLLAARQEPSLASFLPRRGDGLRLSATDLDLYLTCPLKYKFARVFALPQEPTINQRFGILIHSVLDRFHRDSGPEETASVEGLARLNELFEQGWRRTGFGSSDDELQFRDRARRAIELYWERERESEGEPIWLERSFEFRIGPHHLRGRVDRVDRLPSGEHELIDYKTGMRKSRAELVEDLQLSLYRLAAARSWGIEASSGSYYYVLDAEKVRVEPQPGDAERVETTVHQVGEGVLSQDFEPRPSPTVCSWCDYRLVCPAAES